MSASYLFDIERHFKDCLASINHPLIGGMQFDTLAWQRYPCPESRESKTSARYRAHTDSTPMLKFQCKRCNINKNFPYRGYAFDRFTQQQRIEMQNEASSKRARQIEETEIARAHARLQIQQIWKSSNSCLGHAYFKQKGLSIAESDGLRIDNIGRVLCPIRLITGELISLQTIPLKGIKLFRKNTSPKNGFHIFGSLGNADEIFFSEGVTTSLSIQRAVNKPVICVYGKHFSDIAPIIAKAYPGRNLIYCVDLPGSGEKFTSEDNAKKAIQLVGGRICLPNFSMIPDDLKPEVNRSDYNDLFVLLLAKELDRTTALGTVRKQIQQN